MENERTDAGWEEAELVWRDRNFRREREQRNFNFPCSADHDQDHWPLYPLLMIPNLQYVMTIHNNIHTHIYYKLKGRRQKTVYRHGSAPQRSTHEYTSTFEPLSRR